MRFNLYGRRGYDHVWKTGTTFIVGISSWCDHDEIEQEYLIIPKNRVQYIKYCIRFGFLRFPIAKCFRYWKPIFPNLDENLLCNLE